MVKKSDTSDRGENEELSSNIRMGRLFSHPQPGEDIVLTGISGTFPRSQNVYEFRDNLFNKVDMVTKNERWGDFTHPEIPLRSGTIPEIEKFDAGYFGIHERQAHSLDPMCRIFQEKAIEAIIDAGLHPSDLENTRTGVFIGACFAESESAWYWENKKDCYAWTGGARSMIARRISYFLKLRGPSYVTDTACSSSLYAIEHAFRALRLGEIDNAIVGGTNICLHPFATLQFARLGVLSPDGSCKSFDKGGNGYVRSEGIAAVLLQKSKHAKRIYAQLIYAKTNCDGFKEQGITFPSKEAQKMLFNEFYDECNIDRRNLSYLEAHGTGTTVGDPEECIAIDEVFTKNRDKRLLIGSVKSNTGHAESSSGLFSVAKCIIAMETGIIPPNINFIAPREEIKGIVENRLKVVANKMPFEDKRGLIGIDSFGFGGGNCHILLRWNPKEKVNGGLPTDNLPRIVCVSGRTREAVTSLLDNISGNRLDTEYIRLLHNVFRKNIRNHLYRGYTIATKSGEITRSIMYSPGDQRLLYVGFGELDNWYDIGNHLMSLPAFADSIQRSEKILLDKGISIEDILLDKSADREVNHVLGSLIVQIGITDTLHLLGIRPCLYFGYSFGELLSAYCDGVLSLEETINCAVIINAHVNGMNDSYESSNSKDNNEINANYCENGCQNGTFPLLDNLRTTLSRNNTSMLRANLRQSLEGVLEKKDLRPSKALENKCKYIEYLLDALLNGNSKNPKPIARNTVVLKIGNSTIYDNVQDITAISCLTSKTKNYIVEFLKVCGSLYVFGYAQELEKLYPVVELPVSRGTKMISPYIRWKHNKEWFTYSPELILSGTKHAASHIGIMSKHLEWKFIEGHVIDGRNLFPATGYLYLAWKTFASSTGVDINVTSVVFENCKFLRATTVPDKGFLRLNVAVQFGTGNFEICENDAPVVTGRISFLNNGEDEELDYHQPTDLTDSQYLPLKNKDIYKELRLRGYNYKGEFRAIQMCNNNASEGYIKWDDNWITFIDNMLQMKILQQDTRCLYVPTQITKLTIRAKEHLDWINSNYIQRETIPNLPVFSDEATRTINCGGICLYGLMASSISRRKDLSSPVLERYKFVPNITNLETNESVRVNIQIILENTLSYKVKAVELVDEHSQKDAVYLTPIIQNVLEDQPLIQPVVKILSRNSLDVSVDVEDKKLTSECDCLLVIGTNILNRSVLKEALIALKENGFVLSREPKHFDVATTRNLDIVIATIHRTPTETLVLFQKKSTERRPFNFTISSLNDFSWVPQLQRVIKNNVNSDIVLHSEDEPNSGILGLVNCLRREANGSNIRCIFMMDKIESFHKSRSFYNDQINNNLAINVYKDGQWGTYRHLLLNELNAVESEHWLVNVTTRGDLSSLRWIEGPLRHNMKLASEQMLIQVHYAALNFRDIMTALGKINVDVITQDRLKQDCVEGLEFSGKDERGNRIMGMTNSGALSSLVVVNSKLTFKVPDSWSLEEAATVPVVYLTAIYALFIRGQLKQKESILIHSGSGGVGQAAIQLALNKGCTVFTTVGTQEKRDFLKKTFPKLRDHHIGNSRDESFEQMIHEETRGRGVDMVLNSLAENKLLASVRCLARGGRFIEIGKFDLVSNNKLSLLLFKKSASFHGVMLDMLFKENPRNMIKLYEFMCEAIKSGAVIPLNRTTFKFNEIEQAFRFMATGKHTGKVLIQVRETEASVSCHKLKCLRRYYCDPEKVYVIIGGLGGFGIELADWLILRGAKKLVISSRNGISNGYQSYRLRIWKSYGITLKVSRADVTTKSGCQELIEDSQSLGPISSIFNLAVVLADEVFENQTPESFLTSFGSKAIATQHLDELSRKMCPDLNDFVVFSSVSCGRGNPGQTNYGMANSVMERICENRRKDGYSALAIEWGAVGDVGLVAEMQEEHIEREIAGTLLQRISSCLKVLDRFLRQKEEVIVSSMIVAEKQRVGAADNIVDAIANVLGVKDLKTISVQATLAEMGMDSMTAVEIKQILERDFDVVLSAVEIRNLTLARLKQIHEEKCDSEQNVVQDSAPDLGIGIIFRLLGDESTSHLPYMRLKSSVDEQAIVPTLLLFPGLEGAAKVYESLAGRLNAHTIAVQYTYDSSKQTVVDLANSLLPIVEEYIPENGPFRFLAYSYGTLVALEVASILEAKGYTGAVLCIDGSPLLINKLASVLNKQSEQLIETTIMCYLLSFCVPNDVIIKHKENIQTHVSWDDKVNYCVKLSSQYMVYQENFLKSCAYAFYKRIRDLKVYSPLYSTIKSKVKLYRIKRSTVQGLPEDYGLSQLSETPVDVESFDESHVTLLDNEELAETINAFIAREYEIPS